MFGGSLVLAPGDQPGACCACGPPSLFGFVHQGMAQGVHEFVDHSEGFGRELASFCELELTCDYAAGQAVC